MYGGRTMRQRLGKTSGFSLTEMLVVVAIISALAAVLLPVYCKVRSQSRQSICSSNMRQLGEAFTMYADDNDQQFPPPDRWNRRAGWL